MKNSLLAVLIALIAIALSFTTNAEEVRGQQVRIDLIDTCGAELSDCMQVQWYSSVYTPGESEECRQYLLVLVHDDDGPAETAWKECSVESPLAYGRYRPLDLEDATPRLWRLAKAGKGDTIGAQVAAILHPKN